MPLFGRFSGYRSVKIALAEPFPGITLNGGPAGRVAQ